MSRAYFPDAYPTMDEERKVNANIRVIAVICAPDASRRADGQTNAVVAAFRQSADQRTLAHVDGPSLERGQRTHGRHQIQLE
jgi:hypothetical protein